MIQNTLIKVLIWGLIIFSPSIAFAQGDTELLDFAGGNLKSSLRFGLNTHHRLCDPNGALISEMAGILPSIHHIYTNPAALAWHKKSRAVITFSPGFGISIDKLADIDKEVKTNVDEQIEDMRSDELILNDEDYPQLDIDFGMPNQLSGGLVFPIGPVVTGFGVYQPFYTSFDLIGTGLQARLKTTDEDPTKEVTFLGSLDLSLLMRIRIIDYAFSASTKILPKLSAGFTYERLVGSAGFNGNMEFQGVMVTAGNESAFNDENDPWHNDLFSRGDGNYSGSTGTFVLGTAYQLSPGFGLSASVKFPSKLTMSGNADVEQYTIPGLNLQAEEDEDVLDSTELDLSEPTKTHPLINPTGRSIDIEMPGSYSLGISSMLGSLVFSLSFTEYNGKFGLRHVMEKGNSQSIYDLQVTPDYRIGSGINFHGFYLDAGVTNTEITINTPDSNSTESIPFPDLSMGFSFSLSQNIRCGIQLLAIPELNGLLTLGYIF